MALTKGDMVAEIVALLIDNASGAITPAILRAVLIDMVGSYLDANGSSTINANLFYAGPSGAGPAVPSFRSITGADVMANAASILAGLGLRSAVPGTVTYFIGTAGNDGNNGLSSGTPWATFAHAFSVIQNTLDFAGGTVTLQILDGTYTQSIAFSPVWVGGGSLVIQGNSGTPSNVVISPTSAHAVSIGSIPIEGNLTLQNMKLQTTTTGDCINVSSAGLLNIGSIVFGACAGSHIVTSAPGASIIATTNYSITGGAISHLSATSAGTSITISGRTLTLTGSPVFTQFVNAINLGLISAVLNTFSGAGIGIKYTISSNAVVNTGGAVIGYFPGSLAGSTNTGGQYT